jgi:hypothetical protein
MGETRGLFSISSRGVVQARSYRHETDERLKIERTQRDQAMAFSVRTRICATRHTTAADSKSTHTKIRRTTGVYVYGIAPVPGTNDAQDTRAYLRARAQISTYLNDRTEQSQVGRTALKRGNSVIGMHTPTEGTVSVESRVRLKVVRWYARYFVIYIPRSNSIIILLPRTIQADTACPRVRDSSRKTPNILHFWSFREKKENSSQGGGEELPYSHSTFGRIRCPTFTD